MISSKEIDHLMEAILSLESVKECKNFFADICTVKELQDLSQRFSVASLLKLGKSYQEISKETGASTATISRVNRALVYGSGGYKAVLKKMEDK